MSLQEEVIDLFEKNKGLILSGEDIAQKLNVSRNAVWKVVKGLQKDGYEISAATNRGYCLPQNSDIVSPSRIKSFLACRLKDIEIETVKVTASTNTLIREAAAAGAKEWFTIAAARQTEGRGRFNRTFFSPVGTGIYFSVLLRPKGVLSQKTGYITTAAAVAMCEAIEKLSDEKAEIKWVNDIYINGKKVCGILTEAAFGMESGTLEYAALGIGVNVYKPKDDFPEEIRHTATSLFVSAQADISNRLIAEFLNSFEELYNCPNHNLLLQKYRDRSFVLGKKVTVLSPFRRENAVVEDIDEQFRLIVQLENGEQEALSSGEISVNLL